MKRYLVERELIQNNIQVLQKKGGFGRPFLCL